MTGESRRQATRRAMRIAALAGVAVLASALPAQAYIGPGAGFAVLGSALVFVVAMVSAVIALLTWPIRWVFRAIRGRKALARARIRRVVVLGLDGMEPSLVDKYIAEGKMPHFVKLREQGCFRKLATTLPPLSPVAWSSFLTGCNPGKHNIFDFLTIDRRSYLPSLSSVHIGGATKSLKIGKYIIPRGKPDLRLLRKGKPFWNYLGEHDIFSDVIRVPITWPPEKFRGVLLSAMCVPDLRGSQGTFSYYTTRKRDEVPYTGGEQIYVERKGNLIESHLVGPPNAMRAGGGTMTAPFSVRVDGPGEATLTLCGETHKLKKGGYTPWIKFHFKASPIVKVHGICEFLLLNTEPEFELYVTPLQIDPENPAMPIAHPTVYSTYLAKSQGSFATLGLAEDTWALNEKILQDPGFLHQCVEADSEREKMFFDALDKTKRGMVCCVFDGTDRIQHMYWRYIDPRHPAREGFGETRLREAIPEHYARADALVGKTMAACGDDPNTLLLVISDHGFKSFRYGVDLNRWLIENGYMALKEAPNGKRYLATVDWSKTRAYAQGLAGIFLNIEGREAQGIVKPGAEADALREEICKKLTGLIDPRHNAVAINTAYNTRTYYRGPYTEHAPDVICGYNEGYRVSWEAAVGDITDQVFHDNVKAWSGDHCVDPKIVPGIMFANRVVEEEHPRLLDLGPTILDLFGIDTPKHMDGKPLTVHVGGATPARN